MAQINKPSEYFNTILYTGNGSTLSITGVGFAPDLTWVKRRSSARGHTLCDQVRGDGYNLYPELDLAQAFATSTFTSLDSDGFTLGADDRVNQSTGTHVSWNWLGGGTGVSNTDGSITSTVSANTTSGFSIVKWTANLSSAVTVGHGLGTTPKVIIQKAIDTSSNWVTGGFGLDWSGYLMLNVTNIFSNNSDDSTGTGRFFSAGGTEPSSTVFSTNSSALVGSATDIIAYCFAEKKGFSKFGSYTGNGNADGTFVYTGFKPAFVMIKETTDIGNWYIYDTKRDTSNVMDSYLLPNVSNAEGTLVAIDTLSNGFKCRTTDNDLNGTGGTYIYMAFAEQPLVGTNGVPCTAR